MEDKDIRVVQWIVGEDDQGQPIIRHRIEQLRSGHWVEVSVYFEQPDGSLTEVPQ
jgi:hypothetical protein